MNIPFVKLHGLGNDFVVLDERDESFELDRRQLAFLADRRFGIGCDQILTLGKPGSPNALARYHVFNADGSPAEHCGNGARCVARYLQQRGEANAEGVSIEIDEDVLPMSFASGDMVRVNMGRPRFLPREIPLKATDELPRYALEIDAERIEFGAVSMGNPHAVIAVADIAAAPVESVGSQLQHSDRFPQAVNVGFMQIISRNSIHLRVYERGVGETLACGTGACAAVAIGRRWGLLDSEVAVELSGGVLEIDWDGELQDSIWMTGPATYVYEGTIAL